MYLNKAAIDATATANGGAAFISTYYWSSTQYLFYDAWEQNFDNGSQNNHPKSATHKVRAVRAF